MSVIRETETDWKTSEIEGLRELVRGLREEIRYLEGQLYLDPGDTSRRDIAERRA